MCADYTWLGRLEGPVVLLNGTRVTGCAVSSGGVLNTCRQHAGAMSEAPRGGALLSLICLGSLLPSTRAHSIAAQPFVIGAGGDLCSNRRSTINPALRS